MIRFDLQSCVLFSLLFLSFCLLLNFDSIVSHESDGLLDSEIFHHSLFALDKVLLDGLNIHAVRICHLLQFGIEILISSDDILFLRDLLHDQTILDAALCLILHVLNELLSGGLRILEVILKFHALGHDLLLELACDLFLLCAEHCSGNLYMRILNDLLDRLVFLRGLGRLLFALCDLPADIILVLCKSGEFGDFVRELIVELRKDLLGDLLYCALEDSGLACQFLSLIVLRESHINIHLLADTIVRG